ncbi:hypothetical protein AB0M23_11530 [Streptomyces sp. NPDC052077]|uniref:hypothetical protein n=1 Tax=Streptomyces sp. NPDC052077 TaxID=3154757 RepID=UPI00342F9C20
MTKRRRSLGNAFRTLDRVLGGQRPPTRLQRRVAEHPYVAGLCVTVPYILFFLLIAPEDETGNLPFATLGGLAVGTCFTLTALAERSRQRRLERTRQV